MQIAYRLKEAENEIVQERFRKVYNKVLEENPFYSNRDCDRKGISKGDRILLSDCQWLMSENDYDKFLKICVKEFYLAGLTDEEGRYTKEGNTENQLSDIKEKLIYLSVEILPDDFPKKRV